jgi:hypothetical protein
MSLSLILFVIFAVLGLAAVLWALLAPLREEAASSADTSLEDFHPRHTQHFPQLRQTLDLNDTRYMREKAAPDLHKRWLDERRRILSDFLAGLARDFANLERLGRTVASLSPKLSWRDEFRRLSLNFRFRFNFRLARLSVLAGGSPALARLRYLTALIGELSARTSLTMARVAPPSS